MSKTIAVIGNPICHKIFREALDLHECEVISSTHESFPGTDLVTMDIQQSIKDTTTPWVERKKGVSRSRKRYSYPK